MRPIHLPLALACLGTPFFTLLPATAAEPAQTPTPAGAPEPVAAPAAPALPVAAPPANPPAGDVNQRLKELEEIVRKQQETIQRLEGTVEALRKSGSDSPTKPVAKPVPAGPVATGSTVNPRAGNEGFTVQSANGEFRLRLRALLQNDARFLPAREGRTTADTFHLRRVRLVLAGNITKYAEFFIQPSYDNGVPGLFDAYVDVRGGSGLQVRAGKFKTPFSLERLQAAADLHFVERSVAQALVPNRDVGVMVHGDQFGGRLSYAVAALNGGPDGGNLDTDPGRDKDLAARVFARPFFGQKGHALEGLGLGLAATFGSRDEGPSATFRTAARAPFFTYASGTTYAGNVTRLAPQFFYFQGPVGLMGEAYLTQETLTREGMVERLAHQGWFVQASYVITGEKAGFRNVTPRRPFDPKSGHWGAFEVAARYSRFDADEEAFRAGFADPAVSAQRAAAWTIGVNWYLNQALKVQLNYERTDFNGPIRYGTTTRDHEDVILGRLQLQF